MNRSDIPEQGVAEDEALQTPSVIWDTASPAFVPALQARDEVYSSWICTVFSVWLALSTSEHQRHLST